MARSRTKRADRDAVKVKAVWASAGSGPEAVAGSTDASSAAVGRDEDGVRDFVERMALALSDSGMPRMAARVLFTLMVAEADHLTAGELAERLSVSPAAISGATRYLIHLQVIERLGVPGSRRDGYRLPQDSWYVSAYSRMALFHEIASATEQALVALGPDSPQAAARVAEMRDFYGYLQDELVALLQHWRERHAPAD